jgi:hypothetical protein
MLQIRCLENVQTALRLSVNGNTILNCDSQKIDRVKREQLKQKLAQEVSRRSVQGQERGWWESFARAVKSKPQALGTQGGGGGSSSGGGGVAGSAVRGGDGGGDAGGASESTAADGAGKGPTEGDSGGILGDIERTVRDLKANAVAFSKEVQKQNADLGDFASEFEMLDLTNRDLTQRMDAL